LPKREFEDVQEPFWVDNRVDFRRATAATAADGLLLGASFSTAATGMRFQGRAIGAHDVGRSVPHQLNRHLPPVIVIQLIKGRNP
jgi:hypothetical protein